MNQPNPLFRPLVNDGDNGWRKLLLLSALLVAIVMTLSMFAPQIAAFFSRLNPDLLPHGHGSRGNDPQGRRLRMVRSLVQKRLQGRPLAILA
jgi:hypothetical protein